MSIAAPAHAPARVVRQGGELRSRRIESLRAAAALGVLVAHVFGASYHWTPALYTVGFAHRALASAGSGGVYVFFVLSGYLLFRPFAERDFGSGERVDLWRYARNRALRILPLYWFALALFLATDLWTTQHGDWWRFALFLENFSSRTFGTGDTPMWTLVVELQFYVLLPFVALALGRASRRSPRRAALVLVALGAASVSLRLVLEHGHASAPWYDSLPALLYLFSLGMLLALARTARPRALGVFGRRGAADACVLGAVALWAVYAGTFPRPESELAAAAASVAVVGACVLPFGEGSRLLRAFDWRALAILGTASYSLYLLHFPLVEKLSQAGLGWSRLSGFAELFAVAAPVCIAAALLGYALVERPFLRLRAPWSRAREAV